MATIYESQGQQVQVTGLQARGSFNPIQAYNPTKQLLQAGQQRLDVSSKNLEALVGFSKTLSDYTQQYVKKKSEDQYNLGLADIMNGDTYLPQSMVDKHLKDSTILQSAAEADSKIVNQLSQTGQENVAQQFKQNSTAISGWRAYGQAVGLAKRGATESQGFFSGFMARQDKIIPLPDGRMISPTEVQTPEEIKAALAVGQQEFMTGLGLDGINPVILAENLAPTLQAVRAQISANTIQEVARKGRETAISDTDGEVQSEFSNPTLTIEGMFESFQRGVTNYETKGGMSRGKASDQALSNALSAISTLPQEVAEELLTKLSQVRKIANDPNSLSLGSAYAEDFAKTLDVIQGRADATQARQEKQLGDQAEQAYTILKKAEQDGTMSSGDLQSLRKQTIDVLGALVDQGSSDALRMRTELLSDPINIDYRLYRQYREGIAQGKQPTQEQIQKDVASGKLSQEQGRELGAYATQNKRASFNKQFGSSISDAVKAKLKADTAVSFNFNNTPETNVLSVEQMTTDLANIAYTYFINQTAAGKEPTSREINQVIESELPRVQGNYFYYNPKAKTWTARPLSTNPNTTVNRINSIISGPVREASGFDPRTIQLRGYNSGSNVLMYKAEVEDHINRLSTKQPPTPRTQQLAATNGGTPQLLTHQAYHYGINTNPILSSPEGQRLSQYSAVAPWATQRYVSTSGDYRQQMLQLQRIVEAQARAQRLSGKGPGPAVTVPSGPAVGTKDLIRLGLSQGLTPEKAILMAAVALAESGGRPGVHNSDAKKPANQRTGDESYGLWQINMIDTLGPARLKQFGLKNYDQLKDPNVNARAMKITLDSSGLTAWSTYRHKLHLQYMPDARRAYAELKRAGV